MSAAHKPRKRGKKDNDEAAANKHDLVVEEHGFTQRPSFPLAAFFWSARKGVSQWTVLPIVLMVAGLFRWSTGLWGYSGFQTPPMHGDFEAQRHWMEITAHLPMAKWYFYDLEYWGLDYPPLTAYHSWIIGIVGSIFEPPWFALDSSRGIESPDLKLFMRATVLISEYMIYIPALVVLNRRLGRLCGLNTWESSVALMAILMQPGTILIDHAHFQYNTVMLGFVLASIDNILADRLLWSCVFFVASLGFKQMALYYAPVIFAYLVGVCIRPKINVLRFFSIALTTLASFVAVFGPLILGALYNHYHNPQLSLDLEPPELLRIVNGMSPLKLSPSSLMYPLVLHLTQAVHRIFPLARGLFEDKVANIWCTIHTIYKLNRFSITTLSRVSLLATLATITPSCMIILISPQKRLIPYAFASCAWGFFLCSFQVHEKSVLLPLLPMTLLLGGETGLSSQTRAWVGLANTLGAWTMFPLLKRDELRMPYAVLTLLWAYLLGLPPASFSLYTLEARGTSLPTKILHLSFYLLVVLWHVGEAFIPPPDGKPDLWVVLNCIIGTGGFGVCYLWCTWKLLMKSGFVASSSNRSQRPATPRPAEDGKIDLQSKKKL